MVQRACSLQSNFLLLLLLFTPFFLPAQNIIVQGTANPCTRPVITLCAQPSNNCLFSPPISYQWARDGAPIAGGTTQCITADLAGDYSVTITCSNGAWTETANETVLKPLTDGQIMATCKSSADQSGNGWVVGMMDVRNPGAQPLGANWVPPMYHGPNWNVARMGEVFGLAIDNNNDVYVAATSSFGALGTGATPTTFGTAGPGGIYRLNMDDGTVTDFVLTVPTTTPPAVGVNAIPNDSTALGQICYDPTNDQLFVTNHADDFIYRIDRATGNVLDWYDPNAANLSALGWSPLNAEERQWAVAVYGDSPTNLRLYYSRWKEDQGRRSGPLRNEIWSVALGAAGAIVAGSEQLEITMPTIAQNYSNPVSDIAFSSNGTMVVAERPMQSDTTMNAHTGRVLQYDWNGTNWVNANQFQYRVGQWSTRQNGSGGVALLYDYDGSGDFTSTCDTFVWATGDALHPSHGSSGNWVYGVQGMPFDQGPQTNLTSYLIDADANTATHDKWQMGDVEPFKCCNSFPCPDLSVVKTGPDVAYSGQKLTYQITITNNSAFAVNNITIVENPHPAFDPTNSIPTTVSLNAGQSVTYALEGRYKIADSCYQNTVDVIDPICGTVVSDTHDVCIVTGCPKGWTNLTWDCTDTQGCFRTCLNYHNTFGQDIVKEYISLEYDPGYVAPCTGTSADVVVGDYISGGQLPGTVTMFQLSATTKTAPSGQFYQKLEAEIDFSTAITINAGQANSTHTPVCVDFRLVATPPPTNSTIIYDCGNLLTVQDQFGNLSTILVRSDGAAVTFEENVPGECWPNPTLPDCGFVINPQPACEGQPITLVPNQSSGIHQWIIQPGNIVIWGVVSPVVTLATGTYTIEHFLQEDDWACTETQTLEVGHAPAVTAMTLGGPICPGESVQLLGTVTGGASSQPGHALDFDGVNDDVILPSIDMSAHSAITLEAWIRPDDLTSTTYREIIRQQGNLLPDWIVSFQGAGTILSFGLRTSTNGYQELDVNVTPGTYTDGNWHHIAAVYDGSEMRLYSDCQEIGSLTRSGNVGYTATNSKHRIGSNRSISEFFDGEIDEVRIWSVARNQEEIDTGKDCRAEGDEPGLIAAWNLDEGMGLTAADASPNNYDGTLNNGPVWDDSEVAPECCLDFVWTPSTGLDDPTSLNPTASPAVSTEYTLTATGCDGCAESAVTRVTVFPEMTVDAGPDQAVIFSSSGSDPQPCADLISTVTGGTPPYSYVWTPNYNLGSPNSYMTKACPQVTTTYTVTVTDANGCTASDDVLVTALDIDDRELMWCIKGILVCHHVTCTEVCADPWLPISNPNSLAAHLAHGDQPGDCSNCIPHKLDPNAAEAPVLMELEVFPNPFRDATTVSIRVAKAQELTLEFFNSAGQRVQAPVKLQAESGMDARYRFSPENAPAGIYFLKVTGANGTTYNRKLTFLR